MTDSLRDRIAAAITATDPDAHLPYYLGLADAVIDALRDYIAELRTYTPHDTVTFAIRDTFPELWAQADDIADVVIAALGLTEERCHGNNLGRPTHLNVGVLPHGWVHRYVTDWKSE